MTNRLNLHQFDGFTPGPWHRCTNNDTCGENLAIGNGSQVLSKVYGFGYPIGKGYHPQSDANAALIAAAPDLLNEARRLKAERDRLAAALTTAYDLLAEGSSGKPQYDYSARVSLTIEGAKVALAALDQDEAPWGTLEQAKKYAATIKQDGAP